MTAWVLDDAGFVIGTIDGAGAPTNSTHTPPPANAVQPLRFVDGAWAASAVSPKTITQFAFLKRLTSSERIAIRRAREGDPIVDDFMALVDAAKYIDLDLIDTIHGVAYLVQLTLLTHDRALEILGAPINDAERP